MTVCTRFRRGQEGRGVQMFCSILWQICGDFFVRWSNFIWLENGGTGNDTQPPSSPLLPPPSVYYVRVIILCRLVGSCTVYWLSSLGLLLQLLGVNYNVLPYQFGCVVQDCVDCGNGENGVKVKLESALLAVFNRHYWISPIFKTNTHLMLL